MSELNTEYVHKGLVLYVGSGVSQSMGLPSWAGLMASLTLIRLSRRQVVEGRLDSTKQPGEAIRNFIRLQKQILSEVSHRPILVTARAIKVGLGASFPRALSAALYAQVLRGLSAKYGRRSDKAFHEFVEPKQTERALTSELVDSIVQLARPQRDAKGIKAIINYNYDDLLDHRLRDQDVKCDTLVSGHDELRPNRLPCYHVHGVAPAEGFVTGKPTLLGSLMFSEDEYHAMYSEPYRWSNLTQLTWLNRYVGLFVGLSMEDPNIRRLVDAAHREFPGIRNYVILKRRPGPRAARTKHNAVPRRFFEEEERRAFESMGLRVLWVDTETEVSKILRDVTRISENSRVAT